jgi:Domain of unknown function (DUF4833)
MVAFPPRALAALFALGLLAVAPPARAADVQFGPKDVATVFYIGKSDDKNRVDYGIRLDGDCVPIGNSAVFGYWREFESTPVVLSNLSFLDKIPYGFKDQGLVSRTATGADYFVRLKQFDRTIAIGTKKEADGTCSATARAKIGTTGIAQLVSVFAKLSGPFSVYYIDIHGKDFATGAPILERVNK